MLDSVRRWWVSWHDAESDYRPLHDPPNAAILGWWCSGETMTEPPQFTIVAWVEAKNLGAVRAALAKEWPETKKAEFRFEDEVEATWRPTDRFPLSPWMKDRA